MSVAPIIDMSTYGDARSRDVFNRHLYQGIAATLATDMLAVDHVMHGITAPTGSTRGDSLKYQMVKMTAEGTAADALSSHLQIAINNGTSAASVTKVADFTSTNASFGDFTNSYTATFNKGLGEDNATDATKLTFGTGAGTAVSMAATNDRLYVKAANTDISGVLTVESNELAFYQTEGGAGTQAATSIKFNYTDYVAGETPTDATGTLQINLDPRDFANRNMGEGHLEINGYTSAGTAQKVLDIKVGEASAAQEVNFLNSNVGMSQAASTTYKLAVGGDTWINGNLLVHGDLDIQGTLNTINTTEILVEDKNIMLANGNATKADLAGGGITLGTTDGVSLIYDYAQDSWDSSIHMNLASAKDYRIADGADTAAAAGVGAGVTLDEDGLLFGKHGAQIKIGDGTTAGVTLTETSLNFDSDDATIQFGTAATISKLGLSTTSNDFALYLGNLKNWCVSRAVTYDTNGTTILSDSLVFGYLADGSAATSPTQYATKFAVAN